MISALEARDPLAMREVLMHHLNNKRDVVIAQLRASDAQKAAVQTAGKA